MTPRVYLPDADKRDAHLLDEGKSRHLLKVLRLTQGAQILVFDGNGGAYAAVVGNVEKKRLWVCVGEALPPQQADGGVAVHIGQGACAAAKMDWLVEKNTELGATAMTPLLCAAAGTPPRAAQRERWRRLTAAACEQCGRARLPRLFPALSLNEWCDTPPVAAATVKILLSPRARQPLAAVVNGAPGSIVLAAGPESGFSAAEEKRLESGGFQKAHLGARTLRAETAALAALSFIRAWEDGNRPAETNRH